MRTHELKTWPTFFEAVASGEKPFEVRLNDRDYGVGDVLVLEEFDPDHGTGYGPRGYTGRKLRRTVTYVLPGGRFGLDSRWCVLGLREEEA